MIDRYLEVWCMATGLRGGPEAPTIGEVGYCLLGQGALDDVRLVAVKLRTLHTWLHKYTHGYTNTHTVTHRHTHTHTWLHTNTHGYTPTHTDTPS